MAAPKKYKTNTTKKSPGRKSTSASSRAKKPLSRVGFTKLSRKSFLKPWMAIPAILLAAAVGYFVVQFSQASNYSFYKDCSTMPGKSYTFGVGGANSGRTACVKLIGQGGSVQVTATRAQVQNSKRVCADYYGADDKVAVQLVLNRTPINTGSWELKGGNRGQKSTVCGPISNIQASNTVAVISSKNRVGVTSIYGEWKPGSNGTPVRDTRPVLTNCGKLATITEKIKRNTQAQWRLKKGNPKAQELWRRDLIQNCDSAGHGKGVSWTKWYFTGQTRPNPNYNPLCGTVNRSETKTKTIDGGRTRVVYKRNHYYDCKNGVITGGHWTKWFVVSSGPTGYRPSQPSCGANQVKRGSGCVDKIVYAKKVFCPDGDWKKHTRPLYNKNEYSCKITAGNPSNGGVIIPKAPKRLECYNSKYYEERSHGRDWKYCARRAGK